MEKRHQHLEVEDVAKRRYQNRHGGASRDHLIKIRSVQAIQRRRRWASHSSARIYDKPGRLQQVLNKHGGRLRVFGEAVRQNFGFCLVFGGVAAAARFFSTLMKGELQRSWISCTQADMISPK